MRIGLFTAAQWPADENPATFLKALREQVRAARDNGFSSLFVGQHLLTGPMGMFQTNPLLGHLVDDAAGMQIGPGVLLLSMMNPVLVAEEAATLDWLSDGNYVLGAGLGYRPEEFQAMGVEKRERVGRLIEGLELIKRLWTEDSFSFDGEFHTIDRAGINPRPAERIPVWFGGRAPALLERCARIGDGWVPIDKPDDATRERLATIRRHREAAGGSMDGFAIQAQAQHAGGDPDRWRRHADRWRELGATHLAVATHRAGPTDVDGHLARVAEYHAAVS